MTTVTEIKVTALVRSSRKLRYIRIRPLYIICNSKSDATTECECCLLGSNLGYTAPLEL